jgi:biotin synthase
MRREEILEWLREKDESRIESLWKMADSVRASHVGDAVHLRGLIEISNHCARGCLYCGINSGNNSISRYRMDEPEIMACVALAVTFGYGTIVLQGGEDYGMTRAFLTRLIRRIKSETDLAVTLSLGERPLKDLEAWRKAGADRYLLRFETSDNNLYRQIHPNLGKKRSDRLRILQSLKMLGYETGSGIMVGIPGQTHESITHDLDIFREMDIDMIGIGPYLPHPNTPLGTEQATIRARTPDQVPNTETAACKVLALTRILCPFANIPSTTALGALNTQSGRAHGLMRGGNILMPNLTPLKYRKMYVIYPQKAEITLTEEETDRMVKDLIRSLNRRIGTGNGGRIMAGSSSPSHS